MNIAQNRKEYDNFDTDFFVKEGFDENSGGFWVSHKEHNFDKNKSAKYLRIKKPVTLVYSEEYNTLQAAMRRELQVKKWTRVKKEALIKKDFVLLKKL